MDERYPPIAEHGLVGDLQTAALVSSRGAIDWFAAPRFDSPSIFAALLDVERGGYFQLAPEQPGISCKQLYYPDTAVLVTRFMSPDGVGEVVDYMPPDRTGTATDPAHPGPCGAGRAGDRGFHTPVPAALRLLDAAARAGRLPPARYAFEKMQTYANHVGLFAEEIGPSGEQLGNFPQASPTCP